MSAPDDVDALVAQLRTAVVIAKPSADNDQYLCAVTIEMAQASADTIESLTARVKELEAQVYTAAGMLSTFPPFASQHPEVALSAITSAALERKP